ncbi:HEAT repeat domain-containing protein [Streptomyces sp. G-G2]|nr:HEAT repeat domain-containing protein [Streptomyces sp. G-G2]MDJ0385681.1 HEAT repeat domain-containing protein [Streptomyces sp. G-G2]
MHVLAGDPEASVRAEAGSSLGGGDTTAGTRDLLASLLRDPEQGVRRAVAHSLATSLDGTPAVAELLLPLLDARDQMLRLEAAFGLGLREDPRTPEACERVGPLGPEFEHDIRADELGRWKLRQRPSG